MHTKTLQVKIPQKLTQALNKTKQTTEEVQKEEELKLASLNFKNKYSIGMYTGAFMLSSNYDLQQFSIGEVIGFFPKQNRVLMLFRSNDQKQLFTETAIPSQLMSLYPDKFSCLEIPRNVNEQLFIDDDYNYDPEIYSRQASRSGMRQQYNPTKKNEQTSYLQNYHLNNMFKIIDQLPFERLVRDRYKKDLLSQFKATVNYYVERIPQCDFITYDEGVAAFYKRYIVFANFQILVDQEQFDMMFARLHRSCKFIYNQERVYVDGDIELTLKDFNDFEGELNQVINQENREKLREYYLSLAEKNKVNTAINKAAYNKNRTFDSYYVYNNAPTIKEHDKYQNIVQQKAETRRQITQSLVENIIFQSNYSKCRIIIDNMIQSYLSVVSKIGTAQPAIDVVQNVKFAIEIAETHLKDTQLKLIGENILSNLNSLIEMTKLISEQSAFQQYIENDMKLETPKFLPYLQIWNLILNLLIPYSRILYCRVLQNTEVSRKMFNIIVIQFLQNNNDFPLKVFIGYLLTIPQEKHFQGETEIMLDSQIDNYNEKIKDESLQKNFKQFLYLERDIYVQRQTLHRFGIFTDPSIHSNRFPFHVNINYVIEDGNFIAQPSIQEASEFFGKFLKVITSQLCYLDYSYFYSTYEAQIKTFSGPDQNKEIYTKESIFPQQNIQIVQYKMNETIQFIQSSIEMITEVINVSMSTKNAEEKFQTQGIEGDLLIFEQLSEQIQQNNKEIEEKGVEYQIDDYYIIKLIKNEVQLPKTIPLANIYNIVYIDLLNKRQMAELFNDQLYFYIFNLNVTELKQFLQNQYNHVQQQMQVQTIEQIKKFTECLINNMRLLIYTTRSFERNPELFNRLYYLQDFLQKPEIKSFFTQLFQLLTFISEQYQSIFLCQEIQPIVDDIYRIIEEMCILEDYTKQRKTKDTNDIKHDLLNSKYQYCDEKELNQQYQKLSKKLSTMCQSVQFGEIDIIQLPYIAYHRMIRELKLTQIILEQRKLAYQQYIKIFSTKVQEYNNTLTGYIKNKLFANVASTLNKFSETKYNNIDINELKHLAGSIQTALSTDVDDIDEYTIPILSIELNKQQCDDLLKKFELEFLQEIQKYTIIELKSVHSDDSVSNNRQQINNELTNKLFAFLQNEESSIKHFYNDNIIIFTKNLTRILLQLNNILNLLQLIQNWEGWLDISSQTNNDLYNQISDQIIQKTLYYAPLCYLLNNYLIILSLHYQAKKYQLNIYPFQSIKMRLYQLYKNIIIYKQQHDKFVKHINNNDVKIVTQQVNLLIDRIGYSIMDLYPEIAIALTLTSEFILPHQLTIIQKQYVFIDMGLNVLADDIFKQNKRNNQFYYVCLGINLKSYFDKLVFENVRKIYNFISQFTLQYRIEEQQIYIYIEPIHFQDCCQKFLMYISIILNMYQNDINKQVLIFLRDIESILLYIREFYLGIVRLQNLVNDLLQVKIYGSIIEIDFNQVTNDIINDVKEKKQAARMQRKLKKQLEQGMSTENVTTQEKTIADNIEYLKKRIQQQETEKQNQRIYSVSILSSQEILQINGAFSMLKDICNKIISKDETLLRLADEHNYLKQLRRYVVELDQIQVRIKGAPYANAFRIFTTKQNQRLNNMQQAAVQTYYNLFTLGRDQQALVNQQLASIDIRAELGARAAARIENFKQYQLVQSQLVHSVYPSSGKIIPSIHGRVFRQQLQFRSPIIMQYGDFMTWYPLFLKNKDLNQTFFNNITDFLIEESQFRGKILTRLISDYEVFPLKRFVQCPDCMFKFPDLVYNEIHESIIQQVTLGNSYLQNKEFENFMNKIVYQVQIVCISTLSKEMLQELKQYLSIDSNKQKQYIPIMCRIEERCQYDHVIPRIELNANGTRLCVGTNQMQCYNIYLGKPLQSEFLLLKEGQYEIINQVLQGISQRNAIFMLTNVRENQQIKKSLDQIYTHVSRITFRKYQKMHLSQYVFQEQFDELQIKILSGYIMILYGMDQLTVTQQSILIDFVLCIQNKRGEIQNIFQMEINQVKIDAIRSQTEKKLHLSYEQIMTDEDLLLRKSDYRDFEQQLGYIIIQLSCIADQYEEVPGQTENTSIIMLSDQDRYTQLFGQFKDKMLINAVKQQSVSNTLLNDFLKISHQFGNEFYNLATLIDKFNSNFSKINVEDIELVVGLVGDANSNFALASFLVDLLLRQYTEQSKTQQKGGMRHNIQDGFQEYSENNIYQQQKIYVQLKKQTKTDNTSQTIIMNFGILSNLISSVFGLTKQQQTNLFQQAKAFGGILLKSKGLMRLSKQSNFNRYYGQFLVPILSKEAAQRIQTFATENQVSISLSFEVMVLQQILSLGKPVLIDCQNQQYMQVLSHYLSAAQGGECYTVGTWQELELVMQQAKGPDIITIVPTSIGQLQRMLPCLQSSANKKSAKILVLQPRDVTPEVQGAFERRFSLVADLTDLIFLNKMFISNKTFLRTQLTDKLVNNLLSQSELFSKNCSLQYFKKASMVFKVSLFANIYYAAIIQFLHTICKIYQIGSSLDEFLLIRSISDFFLLRYDVFQVINYADDTKDKLLAAGMAPVELLDEKVNGYIQQKLVNGKENLDDQFYQQFNYTTRCYSVKEKYGRIGFSGLSYQELQCNQEHKPEQQDKTAYFEQLFQNLLKTKCNGGKGGSTNLWYTLNDIFVVKLAQMSMFQLIVEFYSVIMSSIFNAAYLITQFQLKATRVLQQKQFEQVLQFLREFDPEKIKSDSLVYNLLNQAFELSILEHRQNIYQCPEIDLKNKYDEKQNLYKSILSSIIMKVPNTLNQHEFIYLNYNLSDSTIAFDKYSFGKGVLTNIDFNRFIKFLDVANLQGQNLPPESDEQTKVEISYSENINVLMENIEQGLNQQPQLDSEDQEITHDNIQFQQLRQPVLKLNELFKSQFNMEFYNSINLQQQEQFLPVFFDDERIALVVLIACCMISPITATLIGERYSGKSTLLKASQLIVRDICISHYSIINDLHTKGQVYSFQEKISNYYLICNEVVHKTTNEELKMDHSDSTTIKTQVMKQLFNSINVYLTENLGKMQQYYREYQDLKKIQKKILLIINIFDEQNTEKEIVQQSIIDEDDSVITDLEQQQPKPEQNNDTKQNYHTIFKYQETVAFPCFILHCTQFDLNTPLHDNVVSILRDHAITLHNAQDDSLLSTVKSDIFINKQIGTVDMSDTSFIIEIPQQNTFFNGNNSLVNVSQIYFQIPNINLSFLRKYFRFLHHIGHTHMNEEWVQSFLNGMNLIATDLPPKLFENFLFFKLILSGHMYHFPTYKNIVVQQKRLNKIQEQGNIVISAKQLTTNMIPSTWAQIITNYDKINQIFEQAANKNNFGEFLSQIIEANQVRQQKVSSLQRTMAFNQDHIFESLDIYSLINALKSQQIDNERIISMLERFTSLNMLGYLNVQNSITDKTVSKLRIKHPWQDTQKHGQLYICLKAVLVQMLLNVYRSREKGQIIMSKTLDKLFANKFVKQMYKQMMPVQHSFDQFNKILPFSRTFKAFLFPNQQNDIYNILIDEYAEKNAFQILLSQGLIASGIQQFNTYFLGHIIQMYNGCTDQIDPMLLLLVFKLTLQIEAMKQKNVSIMKTQIQTFSTYQQPHDQLTGIHAIDYLSNFKYLIIEIMRGFMLSKVKQNPQEEEKKELEQAQVLNNTGTLKDKLGSIGNFVMKNTSKIFKNKSEEQFAALIQNLSQDKNASKQSLSGDKSKERHSIQHDGLEQLPEIQEDATGLLPEEHFEMNDDLLDDIDDMTDDEDKESSTGSEEIEDQDFGGFHATMLQSMQIPKFVLKLNSNGNINQYNKFINCFANIAGYSVASNETFKEAFKQMAKTEAELEEDVSDNQSVSSKMSGTSGTSTGSALSAASSVMSVQQQQEFDEEVQQVQRLQREQSFQTFRLGSAAYAFFTQRRQDRKLIIDIQNIVNTLLTQSNKGQKKKKSRRRNADQKAGTADLLNQLHQFMNDLQQNDQMTVDSIEFLVILQIIRFGILLALGIKPNQAFNQNFYQKNSINTAYSNQAHVIGLTINSQLQSGTPCSAVQKGKLYGDLGILNCQMNTRTSIYKDLNNDETKFYEVIQQLGYPDYDNQNEKLKQKLNSFYEVLIICPKSILKRCSLDGSSMLTMINQLLAQNTFLQYIFDDEEVQNICRLLSLNLSFNSMFSIQDLNAFLSILFSFLVIDDDPAVTSVENEFGADQLAIDVLENVGQVDNIIEHFSNAIEIAQCQKTTCENQLIATQFNCIDYKLNDILFLFQVSECPLPEEYQFPFTFYDNFKEYQITYAQCCVFTYRKISKLCDSHYVSFHEFSQICCHMVNNINRRVSETLQLINFIYIIYHYFDSLALPTQTTPSIQELDDFTVDKMINKIIREVKNWTPATQSRQVFDFNIFKQIIQLLQLNEHTAAQILNKNSSIDKFGPQVIISIYESMQIRDVLFTLLEYLKTLTSMMYIYQKASCFDGILQSLYLTFEQSGNVNHMMIMDQIRQGKLSKSKGNCLTVVKGIIENEQDDTEDFDFDLFLIFCVATMQQAGFNVDIGISGIEIIKQGEEISPVLRSRKQTTYVCQKYCGTNIIHNQMVQFNALDSPILLILQTFGIKQKRNDPELMNLHNLNILTQIQKKSLYFIPQNMLQSCCCLLEAIDKQKHTKTSFIRQTLNVIDGQPNGNDQRYVFELLKKIQILDLETSTREFNQSLARSVAISDNLLVFANFGSKANQDNYSTLRKFLQLRARKVIKKRQTVLIGQQSSLCNQALHNFKIIISYNEGCDIKAELVKIGLYYQDFIDQAVFLGKQQSVKLLREQPGYVQSQLFQAVFGEKNTYRFFAEEFRAIDIQVLDLLHKMKRVTINYFWFNVFDKEFQREIEEENERKRKELLSAAIEKQNKKNMAYSKMTEATEQSESQAEGQLAEQTDFDNDDEEQKQEEDNDVKISDEQFIEKLKTYQADQRTIIKTNINNSACLNQNNQQKEELLHVILTVRELVQLQQMYAQMINNNIITIDQPTRMSESENQKQKILETIYYKSPKAYQLRIKRFQKKNEAKNAAKTVIMKIGMRYCNQISIALEYVFDIVKNLSQTYIATSYILSDILIDKFCQLLQNDLESFMERCKEIQDPDQTRESRDQIDMKEKYPIEYAISYEKELLNDYLIRTILPHLQELLAPSIPRKYNKGFFLLINLIFISLLEFDETISSKKQISMFIEKIMNSMHSTEIDDIRSITGNQIINTFSENSKYYVDPKHYIDNDIFIENLAQFLPQITLMSESLQESWMKLITYQNYPEISSILPWLLKHHSTFVTISQCNNLFAAFLLYYHEKRPGSFFQIFGHLDLNRIDNVKKEQQKKEQKQDKKEKLDEEKGEEAGEEEQNEPEQEEEMDFEDLQAKSQKTRDQLLQALKAQSEDERKITVLPQQIEELNIYSLNTILIVCNVLQPYNLSQNIDFYLYFIMGCLNLKERLTYDILVDKHCTSVDTQVTGTVQNYEFTSQQDRIRALTKCSLDLNLLYTNMLLQLSPRKLDYLKNLPQSLISESCYVLTELLQISVTQTQQYYNSISSIMNSDDYDSQKHQQYLTSLGRTPDNVFVVFYNENADLRTILTTLYDNVTSSVFRNVPLIFTNFFNIQQSREQITIAFADLSSGGDEIVKRLADLMAQKNTIYQYTLLMPIFLMIKQGSRSLSPDVHKKFLHEFQRLISIANLIFAFIQRPQTMKQQYTQTLFFTMVECKIKLFQQKENSVIYTKKQDMRLFNIFFEQMYIQTLQIIQPSDTEIQQMIKVILDGDEQVKHLPIDLSRDQYQYYLIDKIHTIFQKPKTMEELFHLFIKLLFMPRQIAYNMQKGKQQMVDGGVDNLMSQLESDAIRIQNTLHKDKNDEKGNEEGSQQNDEENEEKELLDQEQEKNIVIDFTQFHGNEEFSEDELNFRDDMSEDAEDVDEDEVAQTAQGNDIGEEMNGEAIQNIEESPYNNVITQLVLYESSQNIAGQLNIDAIQQNIIKLIKCQKRVMREQKTDIHVRALLQMALTVYQTVHVETQFQQLVPAIFLIQKYYVQFAGQQTKAQNVIRSVMNSQIVLRCLYNHIKTAKVPFPSLLSQFINNLHQPMVPQLAKQLSPRYLFNGIVGSKLNRQLNAVIGEGEFGAYEDSWVFGAAAFMEVLAETFQFIRFRGSVLGGAPLGSQRLLLLLEKRSVQLQDGKLVISEPNLTLGPGAAPVAQNGIPSDFYVILREIELVNASFDTITGVLCHDNYERRVGYRQIYDAYCYTLVSEEKLPTPEGYTALPFIVNNKFITSIYVRCKPGTCTDDVFFTITKL